MGFIHVNSFSQTTSQMGQDFMSYKAGLGENLEAISWKERWGRFSKNATRGSVEIDQTEAMAELTGVYLENFRQDSR